METCRSPAIWFGGKGISAQRIIDRMAPHKTYVEPFVGPGHVIAKKPRVPHEIVNDIDGNLVNFLLVIRDDPERLKRACETLPYSRQLYEQYKKEPLPVDPFERAVRWFYMNRCGISKGNAQEVQQTGWRHSTQSVQNPAKGYQSACECFEAFAKRMRGVMIECGDFRTIIEKYGTKEALIYCDPPYIGREKFYAGNFTEKDHRDLAKLLNDTEAKVVLSYYYDPMLEELYPRDKWRYETFESFKQVVGTGNSVATEELLLFNWEVEQATVFDYMDAG